MASINWCKQQNRGIQLTEPSDNLSEEYFRNAEESVRVLRKVKEAQSNMWLATTKYYIEYFGVYSVLMKLGIKCEIHECTIALAKLLEDEWILAAGTHQKLEEDKELRIDNQYYLKNKEVKIDFEELSQFLLSIRESLNKINYKVIVKIKDRINKL